MTWARPSLSMMLIFCAERTPIYFSFPFNHLFQMAYLCGVRRGRMSCLLSVVANGTVHWWYRTFVKIYGGLL